MKNGAVTAVLVSKAEGGIKIRYDSPNELDHIPIPTSGVGTATVIDGHPSLDVCSDAETEDGFAFNLGNNVTIHDFASRKMDGPKR